MIWLKIIGAVCVTGATTLYARGMVGELTMRINALKALRQCFLSLKGELRYGVETLPSAFMHVGEHCSVGDEKIRDFFWNVGRRLGSEEAPSLKEVWEEEAKLLAAGVNLDGKECDSLVRISDSLGYLDITQQVNNIDLYLEYIEADIAALTEKYADNCRMYMSLGVMAGLFLTIILI